MMFCDSNVYDLVGIPPMCCPDVLSLLPSFSFSALLPVEMLEKYTYNDLRIL